jgi:trimethylamine--corrinoid protein Co-methyltransferase
MAGIIKRYAAGINTQPEQLACEVIENVGAGGKYLQEAHTLRHFKECWYPELFCREGFTAWQAAGEKSLADRCRERVHEIIETHKPCALEPNLRENIYKLRRQGERVISAAAK